MTEKCSRCGVDKMMQDVRLTAEVSKGACALGLVAYVEKDPNAWVLKGTVYGTLRARVCGGCGHTEIHTTHFEQLYEAYLKSQSG
jgi:hypothetical protein